MKTRCLFNRLFSGALFALALIASQTAHAQSNTVTLTRKFKKDSVTYSETVDKSAIGGRTFLLSVKSKQTVKEIKQNGDVVLEQRSISVKAKFGDMPEEEQPAPPPYRETQDRRGRLVDYQKEKEPDSIIAPEVERLMVAISVVVLPEKPVKTGDTWETQIDNPAVKGQKFTLKSKYLGTERVGKKG